uniref:Uncharacterized protein LOC114344139 n=1 Tax=Diabrotica virgifera virgifera TaxID=50390 RepID=A0A6P7H457_DIAVI
MTDEDPIQTPIQPDNVEMNNHSQNQPPTPSDTQSSKRAVSEITSPSTSVDQNPFKEPLRKSKKAKTIPEDNKTLAEDLIKCTSSFFQDNSDNGYLTQEELIDFFENAYGSADPLSIAKTYTEDIEGLLNFLTKIHPALTPKYLKSRCTRLKTKINKQLLLSAFSTDH